jgi:hypothetical protein
MAVRLEKEILLRVTEGRSCVMVNGPIIYSCDDDQEAIVIKHCLEFIPEILGFAKAISSEDLGPFEMIAESFRFIVNASGRYKLDDGSTLAASRLIDNQLRQNEIVQLEEAAGVSRVCRVCQCTEDSPCAGPCYWVELDLCSACLKAAS